MSGEKVPLSLCVGQGSVLTNAGSNDRGHSWSFVVIAYAVKSVRFKPLLAGMSLITVSDESPFNFFKLS